MRRRVRLDRLLGVLVGVMVGCSVAGQAEAGETSLHFRSGWFSSEERVNGSPFVKESGPIYAVGLGRLDDFTRLNLSELFEVWGGDLDYDGHDVTGTRDIKSDTTYFGTREEVGLSFPVRAGRASFAPLAVVGHKFWIRTRSSEDWNTFYGKAGGGAEWRSGDRRLFVKGGALVPIYTRSHARLSDAGYSDVVTEPRSRVSAFAEGGGSIGLFSISVEYEGMRFGKSEMVPIKRTTAGANGVQVTNGQAYQPDSYTSVISLKLSYSF